MKWNYYPQDVPTSGRPIFCQNENEDDYYMVTSTGGLSVCGTTVKWVYAKDIVNALNTPEGWIPENDKTCWCDVKVRGMNVLKNIFGERKLQLHAEPIKQKTLVFSSDSKFVIMLAKVFVENPDKTFRVKYKLSNNGFCTPELVGFVELD